MATRAGSGSGRQPTTAVHRRSARKKYAAKLPYQYEAVAPRFRGQRRLCEESTILIHARSAKEALRMAKRHARHRQFTFRNAEGTQIGFQFVGVRDLMPLGIECEPEEVWYDILRLVRPMERRAQLIPLERDLNAIRLETAAEKRPKLGSRVGRRGLRNRRR